MSDVPTYTHSHSDAANTLLFFSYFRPIYFHPSPTSRSLSVFHLPLIPPRMFTCIIQLPKDYNGEETALHHSCEAFLLILSCTRIMHHPVSFFLTHHSQVLRLCGFRGDFCIISQGSQTTRLYGSLLKSNNSITKPA